MGERERCRVYGCNNGTVQRRSNGQVVAVVCPGCNGTGTDDAPTGKESLTVAAPERGEGDDSPSVIGANVSPMPTQADHDAAIVALKQGAEHFTCADCGIADQNVSVDFGLEADGDHMAIHHENPFDCIEALKTQLAEARALCNDWMRAALYAVPLDALAAESFMPDNPMKFGEDARHAVDVVLTERDALRARADAAERAVERVRGLAYDTSGVVTRRDVAVALDGTP